MAVSSSRSNTRNSSSRFLVVFLSLFVFAVHVRAAEQLAVRFAPELSSGATGEIVALGELSLAQDGVRDSNRLCLRFPDGSRHPVEIDRQSLVYEFDRLVFCRFAVRIPATLIEREGFALEYGDDVNSPNQIVSALVADHEIIFVPVTNTAEQRVQVIADQHAHRSRWLFLLPIALVVGAALVRRTPLVRVVAVCLVVLGATACQRRPAAQPVALFHAAGFAPVIESVRDDLEKQLHVELRLEGSGSQTACRKIAEFGRSCDVLVLADNQLVRELLGARCSWRIDFAADALVLGVGARAPHVAEAERDWTGVILRDDVRLARVNENLGPIGYRTLLALKLQERLGPASLSQRFTDRCRLVVDDVERLVPLLRAGEVDYAFVYRSTGVAHGIRFIELDSRVNLGSLDGDYGPAEVRFAKLKSGAVTTVTMRGAPIVWSVIEPGGDTPRSVADSVVRHLVSRESAALAAAGFRVFSRPKFYGPKTDYDRFAAVANYGGALP